MMVSIETASRAALLAHAKAMNLDVHGNAKAETLRQAILAAAPDMAEISEVAETPEQAADAATPTPGTGRLKIIIAKDPRPDAPKVVRGGVNGKMFSILRGVPAIVTQSQFESANGIIKVPIKDENDQIVDWTEVPRFPITIVERYPAA